MLGKLECENGSSTNPLYQYLKLNAGSGGIFGRGLKWNYTKFLCNAAGVPILRAGPSSSPLTLEKDILALLNIDGDGDASVDGGVDGGVGATTK